MKIMVCYNGSKSSDAALHLAEFHAKVFPNSRLYVVMSMMGGKDTPVEKISSAEQMLETIQSELNDKKISCETHLLIRGLTPGEDLVRFANENDFDFIFLGIQKKSKVGKFVFGSTAQFIILEAKCPVVTVK